MAHGLRVQPPSALWESILDRWGLPVRVLCDRFRLPELQDVIQGACFIEPRVWQWSSASEDIRALRKIAVDGPLSVAENSRALLTASLSKALVKNDESGNVRMVKNDRNNRARDDVAAALVLAAGAFERAGPVIPRKRTYASL